MFQEEIYSLLLESLNHLKNYIHMDCVENFKKPKKIILNNILKEDKFSTKIASFNEEKFSEDSIENLWNKWKECQKCPELVKNRKQVVIGSGNFKSALLIIGEAPGKKEDDQGLPFVGASGMLLDKMLESIDIDREAIYITNIVKCRPPENRNPLKKEIENCSSYLYQQIDQMKPKIIFSLGNFSTQFILENSLGIGKLRKHIHFYPKDKNIKVLASYHPSALLRNPNLKREAWEDLKKLKEIAILQCPEIFK